jgi:DNA-binding NarL/FixJ family response regulator
MICAANAGPLSLLLLAAAPARPIGSNPEGKHVLSTFTKAIAVVSILGLTSSAFAVAPDFMEKLNAESHRNHIMKKLGIHDVVALMRHAIQEGMVQI